MQFEIHITGDESIIEIGRRRCIHTISLDLWTPDGAVLRTEHMTSHRLRAETTNAAYAELHAVFNQLHHDGVQLHRSKLECQYDPALVGEALYIESHFMSPGRVFPLSRNRAKTEPMATDRAYFSGTARGIVTPFVRLHHEHELELCLHDTDPAADHDWFGLYPGIGHLTHSF